MSLLSNYSNVNRKSWWRVLSLSLSLPLRVRGLRQTGIVLRLSFTGLGKVRRDTLHCILIFHSERFRETTLGFTHPLSISKHSLSVHPVQASPSLFCTLPAFSARPPAGRDGRRGSKVGRPAAAAPDRNHHRVVRRLPLESRPTSP